MKNGKCLKCGSTEVYMKQNGLQEGYTVVLGFGNTQLLSTEDYICMNCGFYERYLVDVQKRLKELPSKWKKAGSS